jgi:hypothetical protein
MAALRAPSTARIAAEALRGLAGLQLLHEARNIRELESPLDLGMGRQDLLHQGRAGARQADDEDGGRALTTEVFARGEELGGRERDLPLRDVLERLGA